MVGAVVNVPWGNTPIPLSQVIESIAWHTAFQTYASDDWHLVFLAAICCSVFYTRTSSWRVRLASMAIGFACPLILIDPEAAVYIFFGPFAVISAVSGGSDGEFYVEDMPEAGAVGLWLLLCLVLTLRELCLAASIAKRGYIQRIRAENRDRPMPETPTCGGLDLREAANEP